MTQRVNHVYPRVWREFLNELAHDRSITLKAFIKKTKVNYNSMEKWMRRNGLKVCDAKQQLLGKEVPSGDGALFVPVKTDGVAPAAEFSAANDGGVMEDVVMTFPNGVSVRIGSASSAGVMALIVGYKSNC